MEVKLNNITFIIVTFKSEKIINNCLDTLPVESKKIIVENSENIMTLNEGGRALRWTLKTSDPALKSRDRACSNAGSSATDQWRTRGGVQSHFCTTICV